MRELSLDELDAEAGAFDQRVQESGDLDGFCSSSDWILPAARALMPPRATWVRRGEFGYAAFMRTEQPDRSVLEPLEAMWGLACPLVGGDAARLAAEWAGALAASAAEDALLVCGLQPGSARLRGVAAALEARYQLQLGPVTRRHCADLSGGVDGFLSRRSGKFRTNLRRALRRAAERGIEFVAAAVAKDAADAAYERLLAVEARSWKGLAGVGIASSEMLGFYRQMIRRLARRGALRLLFARRDGVDLAYVMGGLFGRDYRGLQFSFAAGHEDDSLGNLCQYHQIVALCTESISRYDLGADVDYKRRWAEIQHDTVTLLALRRGDGLP